MAAAKPASNKKEIDPKMRFAHLVVYQGRRASLMTWCLGAGAFMALVIFPVAAGFIHSWLTVLPVIAVIAFFTLTIPPTEEWEYTPWQADPERYEHYTRD